MGRELRGRGSPERLARGSNCWETRPSLDTPARQASWETRPPLDTPGPMSEQGCANAVELPQRTKEPVRSKESDFKISICDEAEGAVAEYSVTEFVDKVTDTLFGLGQIRAANDAPLQAADIIAELDKDAHVIALGDPSQALLKALDTPRASFWSSIIQDAPIDGMDKPLGFIQRCIALAGACVGLMHGNIPMAHACFKAFIHDEIHEFAVRAVESYIGHSTDSNPGTSVTYNHASHRPIHAPRRNRLAPDLAPAAVRRRRQIQEELQRRMRPLQNPE